jgi:hypothetical protein
MRFITIIIAALLMGCGEPSGTIEEFYLEDGTKCVRVVVAVNRTRGITCDFE